MMLWSIIYQHLQPSFFSSFSFSFLLLCIRAEQILLTQKPTWISGQLGDQIEMNCYQNNTDHNWMYWYRQTAAKQQLELIGYISMGAPKATMEDEFEDRGFTIQRTHGKHCSLQINKMSSEDAAVYFCASSFTVSNSLLYFGQGTRLTVLEIISIYEVLATRENNGLRKITDGTDMLCVSDKLYFGQGTRLTVLEKGHILTPPSVTIFSPSKRELEKKQKATIVCLATDFYPDHVILTWYLNNKSITDGIKTEEPKYENKKYSLISRLRITENQWQNSKNNFKCKVDFYNSSESTSYEASIIGEECDSQTSTNELYLRQANLGKLVYILLIFKSALYGAFIMHLKIRKKSCGS
ncbi:M1-specific T cell receptor beta chain-like [Pantherophis guttatus]|uniref:M1-specific T cell receptor beta chain-like n=1 Tax=Pantherophis guttatus TaxID=94885 RepID=UPI00295A7985|nr:M1-specific T cell receptor beta chain-like [Pantherophis guttatus]